MPKFKNKESGEINEGIIIFIAFGIVIVLTAVGTLVNGINRKDIELKCIEAGGNYKNNSCVINGENQ